MSNRQVRIEFQGFAATSPDQLSQDLALKVRSRQEFARNMQQVIANQSNSARFINQALDFQSPDELAAFLKQASKSPAGTQLELMKQAFGWIADKLSIRIHEFTDNDLPAMEGILKDLSKLWSSGLIDLTASASPKDMAIVNAAIRSKMVLFGLGGNFHNPKTDLSPAFTTNYAKKSSAMPGIPTREGPRRMPVAMKKTGMMVAQSQRSDKPTFAELSRHMKSLGY